MAVKQSMKPRTIAKKPTATSKRGVATKTTETAKAPAAKATARKTKATAAKAAKTTTTRKTKAVNSKVTRKAQASRKTKAPAAKMPRRTKASAATGGNPALNGQGQDLIQQTIQTQVWMTNEIAELRAQLAQTGYSLSAQQNSELEQLRQENADLREKASRLDQMAYLLQGQPPAKATRKSPAAKIPRMPKATRAKTVKAARINSPKVVTPRKAKAAPVAKVSTRKAATKSVKAVSVTPTARKTRSGVSILQDAAAKDVHRTFKSCWPIVFKIEEWNQKHPNQLAKVSQTMLNKSGVNFSRAKGFMDNYGELVESYHQQIGLSKANSGKFNEVYEFIRSALGKGKKA